MKQFILVVWVILAAAFLSCHKSATPPATSLSGEYVEISPDAGATLLNFVDGGRVIATGPQSFLNPSGPDTLSYFLSSGSRGSMISFVTISGGFKDTLSCQYSALDSADFELSFPGCAPGVPCYALGGVNFLFRK